MPSRVSIPGDEYDLTVARGLGLGQLFYSQAQKSPKAIAVVDGKSTYTYAQLHYQASNLALQISQCTSGNQEPVGIVVQHGVADVVAQLAVIYAGGSCTPMDPTLADHQIQGRLARLNARCVLTDRANRHRDLPLVVVCIDDAITSTPANEAYPIATGLEHCTHLIHTSGTTGEAKAVRVAARSILHVVFHAPFEPVYTSDVVAHVNNSSFDVSLFDIWAPLLRGAQIAILSKAVLLDIPVMASEINRLGITVMATTTALLNLAAFTYPQAFANLRICFIGGEVANLAALKIIFDEGPPEILINAYGPTECCIFCLAHRVTPKDIRDGSISIGMPIGRTIACIANDAGTPSDEGELLIGGPGLSPGYANQPGKNAAAFINTLVPSADAADVTRLYRTGDIVRRRPDGQIDYIGRRDHQVKIRGFRIELGAVETALLGTGHFAEAVAMKVEMLQKGAGSILVAYAVPADIANPPAINEALELVKANLPDYMVPQLELISQMPLNSHAKVDRIQLKEIFGQRWKDVHQPELRNISQDIRSTLAGLWTSTLASPVTTYEDHDDFVSLGGTSLQASLLISQIRRIFGVHVSLLTLYDNSSLGGLTSVISKTMNGRQETLRDERSTWLADSMIADSMPCPSGPVVDWRRDTEGRIFITGATGFVGAFMLADLLRMPQVHQIGCLVRASDSTAGLERLRAAMAKYNLWEECFADKLLAIPGLLEDEYLGMGHKRFNEIALWASAVFHLGARVNYTQPYSLHRPANTLGTLNVIRFACAGRVKPIHYVSSISCFGPTGFVTGASTVREDEPLLPHLAALPYDHGYAQSQWVAEQLLRRLMDRGFPIAVYRPGFITGHSQTGACNPDDFFCRLIHACCEMGCYPKLPNQRKEFVPVDYVSSAILHIAASPTCLGRAYHLVPPSRAVSVDMDESMDLVGKAGSSPMYGVSYTEWIDRLAACPPQRLLPLQPMLAEKVQDGRTRWELYENMPVYETTNTDEALESYPGGLKFPVLGVSLMKKYLDFLQARQ
ncbi:AMP-binding enzyme [Hirsutella rhossiliensis]|uniref:AMP-binding enzyme domain-containing protein n=1 Tax=Hirsutella rhossiliensis TaxID=111463 RepID=A0A9P8MMW8_9HYPO|nr:AMP-binding enzyme domain-containing protein [Hirsutella rhossiliensis]KAH0958313.1 AMP-binding enzyme domain-containing protein [Hirsutella rhossiliensis]